MLKMAFTFIHAQFLAPIKEMLHLFRYYSILLHIYFASQTALLFFDRWKDLAR